MPLCLIVLFVSDCMVYLGTKFLIFKKYQKFRVRVNHTIRHNQKTKKRPEVGDWFFLALKPSPRCHWTFDLKSCVVPSKVGFFIKIYCPDCLNDQKVEFFLSNLAYKYRLTVYKTGPFTLSLHFGAGISSTIVWRISQPNIYFCCAKYDKENVPKNVQQVFDFAL